MSEIEALRALRVFCIMNSRIMHALLTLTHTHTHTPHTHTLTRHTHTLAMPGFLTDFEIAGIVTYNITWNQIPNFVADYIVGEVQRLEADAVIGCDGEVGKCS